MKISNETKVGALAAVAITVLILGYNYLKGSKLFSSNDTYYVTYSSITGLGTSDDVLIRGYEVGKVTDIELQTDSVIQVVVEFTLHEKVKLPVGTEARIISSDLLGDKALDLSLGDSDEIIPPGSFIPGSIEASIQEAITVELLPVKNKFEDLIKNIDSVISIVQATFDPGFQTDVDKYMISIREALENVKSTSLRLDQLVERESQTINNILSNIDKITENIEENEAEINHIIANISGISDSLAKVNFVATMGKADSAIGRFASIIDKIESGDGNLALLLNDRELYDNLQESSKRLDELVEDIRKNPRKYIPPLIKIGGKN